MKYFGFIFKILFNLLVKEIKNSKNVIFYYYLRISSSISNKGIIFNNYF